MDAAEASARAHQTEAELGAFRVAVAGSRAVMNRSFGALHSWLNGGSPLFLTFHRQVRLGGRHVGEDVLDQQRISAENTERTQVVVATP
jgi:hypothetical protein